MRKPGLRHGCVAGATCDASERCAAVTYLDDGQPCSSAGTPCGWGLQCSFGTCRPLSAPGDSCGTEDRCQQDLLCNASNKCAPLGALGVACKDNEQCDTGLFCNLPGGAGTTGACATLHVDGQSCTVTGEECASDFVCTATQSFPDGTCQARLPLTSTCFDATPNPCARGLYCNAGTASTGTCVSQLADGAPCSSNEACASERCGFTTSGRVCLAPEVCRAPTP